jgi:lipopolysaccharide export LptBFGC system permease protein LptF
MLSPSATGSHYGDVLVAALVVAVLVAVAVVLLTRWPAATSGTGRHYARRMRSGDEA